MNRSPRRKNQPKKFTPTQPTLHSAENYLLRFEDDGELVVAKRTSIRSIIEDKAIIGTGEKRRTATIEVKGSYSQCNAMYEQLMLDNVDITNDKENDMNESEEDDALSDDNNQIKTRTRSPLTQKRKLSTFEVDDSQEGSEDNLVLSQFGLASKDKRRRLFDELSSNTDDQTANKSIDKTLSLQERTMYQNMDDMHRTMFDKLEKKLVALYNKVDRLIPRSTDHTLDAYREKEEVFPPTVMYNDINLLTTRGRDIYDFSRLTLRLLFSSQELGTCILPPARTHLSRPPLDIVRFNHFHEAVRVKYRISTLHYDSCYSKLTKPRLCDFLIDERKRQLKARNRQSITEGALYPLQ